MTRFADIADSDLDLSSLRERLEGSRGPQFWRSLEELAGSEDFQEYLHREFPRQASEWNDPSSRRQFFRLMGASLALAGLSGCVFQPPEEIVPYVKSPEEIVPGHPLFFASAFPLGGYGLGVRVESHMGRPTKVEGNPKHPASLGATDIFAQAAILALYDPDRAQTVTRNGRVSTYDDLLATLIEIRGKALKDNDKGKGLRVLTGATTSPTLLRQLGEFLKAFPEARWIVHEPASRGSGQEGARLAFGQAVDTIHHYDRADVIVSLDADFLTRGAERVRAAREYGTRRDPDREKNPAGMNRLYVAESMPSITGAMAEHRLPARSTTVAALGQEIARGLDVSVPAPTVDLSETERQWVATVVEDLANHRGTSLVIAGEDQPAAVQALVHALNDALGNAGKTVEYIASIGAEVVGQAATLVELSREMVDGQVETLIILGGNPAFTAPADLGFADALEEVRLAIRLGAYDDETSLLCNWQVPEAHFLETWGDIRAFDGTATIQQPLIAPLYNGITAIEIMSALLGQPNRPSRQIVADTWRTIHGEDGFDNFWRASLHDGIVADSASDPESVALNGSIDWSGLDSGSGEPGAIELCFRPDPTIWDGQFANNGWLQELPKPLTKLTWDNPVLMSPRTADRLGVGNEDLVELRYRERVLEVPVWIVPGHADDSATLYLGYGRRRVGRVGDGVGFDAYALRTSEAPWFGTGLEVTKTTRQYPLATTQHHFSMEGRELIRVATVDHYREHPDFAKDHHDPESEVVPDETLRPEAGPGGEGIPEEMTLFQKPPVQAIREAGYGNSWGMVINLNTCIGCSACVVACQAENNIPVVGKDQVRHGREMHWIRVDRYYEGTKENPKTYHQPIPCMHCERAPCELVCPVAATTHSPEGLNEMVYNRCVGTRYCSNNCPYKVRRFNFFRYQDVETTTFKLMRNPDVTVRSRGVMEKCTYCVQRINRARIHAEIEFQHGNRPSAVVRYGELETACQGVCPTRAITFGNLNDREGEVAILKTDERNYALLAELNTQPRTTYLAKLVNPNTALEGGETQDHG